MAATSDPALPKPTVPSIIVEPVDPLLGLNLSGFVVNTLLASGGMGLVYLAVHETIGRRAAVKVLKPEVAADEEWTKRFLTEARALASLKHRNLIEVLNFGKTPDGRQYLMMEFLEGEPLDAYIARIGTLPFATALSIAEQVLNGLAEAHKKGVVHRDLKPSNVFLLREHNGELLVKVIDFGLARQEPIALLTEGTINRLPLSPNGASLLAGTPEYIAPEQAQGLKVSGSADLYSLGVVLFEMLSGQLPFSSDTVPELLQKHLSHPPPRLSSLVNNLPEGIEEFIDSLLQKDPSNRPASADAARVTCQRLLKRLAQEATAVRVADPRWLPTMKIDRQTMPVTESPAEPSASPTNRAIAEAGIASKPRRWPWAVAALLLLLLLGWVVLGGVGKEPVAVVPAPPEVVAPPEPTPPPPAAVEPKVEPVAAVVEPVKEDPLPPAPLVLPVPKAKPASRVVVAVKPTATCTPDAEWVRNVKADLTELQTLGARREAVRAEYERFESQLNYRDAHTPEACGKVQTALDQLKGNIAPLIKN